MDANNIIIRTRVCTTRSEHRVLLKRQRDIVDKRKKNKINIRIIFDRITHGSLLARTRATYYNINAYYIHMYINI